MAVLNDGEFELDGYGFGGESHPIVVQPGGFDPGTSGLRNQDNDNGVSDGLSMGRDTKTPPLWGFTLMTNQYSASDALDALEDAAAQWDAPDVRSTPGAVQTMRYNIGGRTRRVYGRTRRFAQTVTAGLWSGTSGAVADFQLVDGRYYDDELRQQSVTIVPASTGGLSGVLTGPISTSAGGARQGVIPDVGGKLPAPIVATIHGPITNPWISNGEWKIELKLTLAYDQSVTIDARPWRTTVLRNDGASLAGALTRNSRLDLARLRPGSAELTFGGTDATGTATCSVSWRPVFPSL
jgi:hypothetical protein